MFESRQETDTFANKGGEDAASAGEPVSRPSPEAEALDAVTGRLVNSFLGEFTGLLKPAAHPQRKAQSVMKKVVDHILKMHKSQYDGMIDLLLPVDDGGDVAFVGAVAAGLFSDGNANWGRVASLIAFGAAVCRHFKDEGREAYVEMVGDEIASYLLAEQREWLIRNGSWDGFVDFFQEANTTSTLTNVRYDVLEDRTVLTHIDGTYDTYRCNTCLIVLSGYKRGDPHLHEHVRHGGGRCLYVRTKFVDREHELTALQGKLRFQRGLMAFPEHLMYSSGGYVRLAAVKYCLVCACPEHDHRTGPCVDMRNRLKKGLERLKLPVPVDDFPLFDTTLDPPLECDGSFVDTRENKFHVLGAPANMYHLEPTTDTHKCFVCDVAVKGFVKNDTLLGEHIYHSFTRGKECSYLIGRFKHNRCELMRMLGEQRYRKGYVAFPDEVADSSYGCSSIDGVTRCCVCSIAVDRDRRAFGPAHFPQCGRMKDLLQAKLKDLTLLP